VKFTDTSIGDISSWLWNFGDGTTSTEKNPVHTYIFRDSGDFTVSLTVTGLGGTDTETKTKYIHVNIPPIHINVHLSKKKLFRSWYDVTASITATQNNQTGLPVAGVTVVGTWSGAHGGIVSNVTKENGKVSFTTEWVPQRTTVTFTVNKVIIDGKEYDFAGRKSASIKILI
jgi:PKD repeat protein